LAVDVTVNLVCREKKSPNYRCLHVPETIEWE